MRVKKCFVHPINEKWNVLQRKLQWTSTKILCDLKKRIKTMTKKNLSMLNSRTRKEIKKLLWWDFDEQIEENKFTAFLRIHAKEITSVIKNTRSLKGPRHIFGKVLDSDHFDQYLKYSVYEKAEEILYKFFMKSPHKNISTTKHYLPR